MEVVKAVLMVSGAAIAGSFIADQLDKHVTPRLGDSVNASDSTKRALRLGYTASGALVTYGLLRAVF